MNNKKLASIDQMIPLITEQIEKGGSVSFTPMGISMKPMLRHGEDRVVLSPVPEKLKKYDLPLYRRDNGKHIMHRVVRVKDTYTCMGDNQFIKEKGIRHDQLIGVVTSFTHKGKEYSADSFGYKFYCRFWHYTRFPRRVYRFCRRAVGKLLRNIGIIK